MVGCVAALVMMDSTLVGGGHSSQNAAVANPLSFVSNRGALPLSSQGRIGRLKRHLETKAAVTVFASAVDLPYSDRNATAGSTRVARRVGRYAATKATAENKRITVR